MITHQTSARAIRKGMARMSESFGDVPRHDAVITVDRYGNTASTTHTVALVEELAGKRHRAGRNRRLDRAGLRVGNRRGLTDPGRGFGGALWAP